MHRQWRLGGAPPAAAVAAAAFPLHRLRSPPVNQTTAGSEPSTCIQSTTYTKNFASPFTTPVQRSTTQFSKIFKKCKQLKTCQNLNWVKELFRLLWHCSIWRVFFWRKKCLDELLESIGRHPILKTFKKCSSWNLSKLELQSEKRVVYFVVTRLDLTRFFEIYLNRSLDMWRFKRCLTLMLKEMKSRRTSVVTLL